MRVWNCGIIGAGLIADFHARAVKEIDNAKLAGFFDIFGERSQNLAEKYSVKSFSTLNEMLANRQIDAVSIATASGAHLEPALAVRLPEKGAVPVPVLRKDLPIEGHRVGI